jgi:hypothetical protein
VLLEVVDEHDGGQRQKVQQVHAYREADDVGQQDDVAVTVHAARLAFPLEDEPEDEGRHEAREGVYLAFHSRKPEGVGPRVGQSAYQACAQHGGYLAAGHFLAGSTVEGVAPAHKLARQGCDGPEQQQYSGCRKHCTHAVDPYGSLRDVASGKVDEEPSGQVEEGVSGRVAYFALVGAGDKLRAIPKARCRLYRTEVGVGSDYECNPSEDVVEQSVLLHVSF